MDNLFLLVAKFKIHVGGETKVSIVGCYAFMISVFVYTSLVFAFKFKFVVVAFVFNEVTISKPSTNNP